MRRSAAETSAPSHAPLVECLTSTRPSASPPPTPAQIVVVGSIAELAELTGQPPVTDLHRETIDGLTIPSKRPGHPPLKRVDEVFDCGWHALQCAV